MAVMLAAAQVWKGVAAASASSSPLLWVKVYFRAPTVFSQTPLSRAVSVKPVTVKLVP